MGKKLHNTWNPQERKVSSSRKKPQFDLQTNSLHKGNKIKYSWDDFKHFYILIASFPWLELYAYTFFIFLGQRENSIMHIL